ncbi:MBL fold metallo-hydrolase [Endozoicomonas arenosclerae]|uniref:MBL fold metallo-hydrolase n=1 Tax=Endozoicomonas arenosclerae TaxID=1633495 RepID=UPI000784961D|nr:MBL fold metallo-hydrolase [Endozoicomonas arenosclerae]
MAKFKSLLGYAATAVVFTGAGMLLSETDAAKSVSQVADSAKKSVLTTVAEKAADGDVRTQLLIENPELIKRVMEGGGFGGSFSRNVAQHMFGEDFQPAIDDAIDMTTIEPVGDRMWLIRMPLVNAALFETDEGLVVVDTGMAPAGPAILKVIRSVSDKPIHTIILTHGHVDHAYGTRPLVEDSPNAQVIAQENIIPRFERYLKLPGSFSKYMSQPYDEMPKKKEDIVWPTKTFRDRLEIEVGGEQFVLQHRKGETDDQLYVWVPGRKALASADYYQGFLPNVGNGKRAQRYVEEWAFAMREMAGLDPEFLLPAHGAPIVNKAQIKENFTVLAEAFESITEQTLEGLNKGVRKDLIVDSIELPEALSSHPTLAIKYVSPKDISKMLLKQYTGWWDDIPSNWTPASQSSQSAEIVNLAGGIDALVERGNALINTDIVLASHLADWAWMADPDNANVQKLVIDVYRERINDLRSNTQEILAYLDQMTLARSKQLQREE